jgi:alpha-glucosidase
MRKVFLALVIMVFQMNIMAKDYEVKSPSGKIVMKISTGNKVEFSVMLNGKEVIVPSEINMVLDNGLVYGADAKVKKESRKSVSETINFVVKRKYASLSDNYNQLKLDFKGGYSLLARVYDDGAAYRWVSGQRGEYKVQKELASFNFAKDYTIWFPEEEKVFTHQERSYKHIKLSEVTPERFCSTGTLIDLDDNVKVFISEADLISYPGMFLKGSDKTDYGLVGKYAGYALEVDVRNDRDVPVSKHADFLAKVDGPRAFPWRAMIITTDDKQLVETELIYKLATPLKLDDASWVKPGKVAWDWWNALNVYGVDFKSGVNNDTYKYFIDFASKYGIEYVVLDEGWYHLGDVLSVVDDIDIPELVAYGKERNVDLILWVSWKSLDDKLDAALEQYAAWGVKGIKVDFMARDDQWMVDYYHEVAEKAAAKHLLVDFHGSYKPTGLRRTYPNVITREGVKGLEHNKWAVDETPDHNVTLPFIRMVSGPMDFTPGAMMNATKKNFRIVFDEPMSQGTRCHQLAMYVVFESPLQMLADSPSKYYPESESMKFLSAVPSVWDDTKVLQAKVGEYIAVARRSGDTWFVGAMTGWDARSLDLDFDFLHDGEYSITIWKDGVNSGHHGSDYQMETSTVRDGDVMSIELSPGGGWAAIITKK